MPNEIKVKTELLMDKKDFEALQEKAKKGGLKFSELVAAVLLEKLGPRADMRLKSNKDERAYEEAEVWWRARGLRVPVIKKTGHDLGYIEDGPFDFIHWGRRWDALKGKGWKQIDQIHNGVERKEVPDPNAHRYGEAGKDMKMWMTSDRPYLLENAYTREVRVVLRVLIPETGDTVRSHAFASYGAIMELADAGMDPLQAADELYMRANPE